VPKATRTDFGLYIAKYYKIHDHYVSRDHKMIVAKKNNKFARWIYFELFHLIVVIILHKQKKIINKGKILIPKFVVVIVFI